MTEVDYHSICTCAPLHNKIIMLTDLSLMPFGKYKGTPMQDIPVNYLHYLWVYCNFNKSDLSKGRPTDNIHKGNCFDVSEYIAYNLYALKQENDDLIWQ